MTDDVTRRHFVAAAALGAIGASLLPDESAAAEGRAVQKVSRVLFQGDSITDSGRDRAIAEPNRASALGTGYPLLLASALLRERPRWQMQFLNRGISGHRVPDLQARWQTDTIDLDPELVSVLIGVNDFWHKLDGRYTGTVADYESQFTALLASTRTALPKARLVVLEPFVLRTGKVDERWFPEFDERRAAAARVAHAAHATWVPLQKTFDRLAASSSPDYWASDGVHPTPAGHAAIAGEWRKAVGI